MTIRLSTKDAIIEAAFKLLSGDPRASLSEIAAAAGVGRATLHRHFSSRDELIRTLALIAIEEMDTAVAVASEKAESYSDALRQTLQVLIPLGDRHGFLAREPIDEDPDIAAELKRLDRETIELVEAAKKEGLFDQSLPATWVTRVFDELLYVAWESVKSGETTHAQASQLAWHTLTQGLGKRMEGE